MIMLARTVATVQAKSSHGTATGNFQAGQAWAAPGAGGQQLGLTVREIFMVSAASCVHCAGGSGCSCAGSSLNSR